MFQEVNFNLENKNMAVALAPTSFNKLQLCVKKNTPCLFIKMVTFSLPFYTELGMKCFKRSCIVQQYLKQCLNQVLEAKLMYWLLFFNCVISKCTTKTICIIQRFLELVMSKQKLNKLKNILKYKKEHKNFLCNQNLGGCYLRHIVKFFTVQT